MPELIACDICGKVHAMEPLPPGTVAKCVRCGSRFAWHTPASLQLTAAFSLAALLLYAPANMFPIMRLSMNGVYSENTIWSGTVRLFNDGDYVIAVIVFLASILIPLLKLLGLFFLVIATWLKFPRGKRTRTWLFRFIEGIGRWAMLDVFVLAILVSLVKLQGLATIVPGRGLFAFGGVVVFTLLASASFDPWLIWEDSK